MAVWKQLVLCLSVLFIAFVGFAWFVPGADAMLKRAGLPETMVAAITPSSSGGDAGGNPANGMRRGPGMGGGAAVVAEPVVMGVINDRLTAIGTGEAIQSVVVMPQLSGTLAEVLIKAGERVKKGQVIARLERREQEIARDRAEVALKSARERTALYSNLGSAASRIDAFDAGIAEENAVLELQTAELELSRRDIVAPIDGIAGIVTVVPGDNVTSSTPIVTLDDRSALLVDFWVPERFAPLIEEGQPLMATSVARPGQVYQGTVAAIDNRIDQASRTLRVRAGIMNEEDQLRAGMAFNVSMEFPGDLYPAVDPLAIQWDSDGSYVWHANEGKAEKVRVRIVQRNPDAVLVAAELEVGDQIVTEGVQRVREGAPVTLIGQEQPAESTPGGAPVASR
ncbi:efflux RND transporter periplasmic adaptor subunit [Peteryoungia desertarenae]|uniref:Efflux RND transporter periplasmic adaptor subunit n=1 Tax=Peteryoungia desertarenae TaxID=1813451 RepID=A0ABX6QQC1_9HYPH|nr:efflux RND transporter periplasmic adaptor subunit [Peteryoungia desertarenae]QLF70808.1 efflux RND transporter periplasmic adaptor subunit [Peteryoungia desertarenae]